MSRPRLGKCLNWLPAFSTGFGIPKTICSSGVAYSTMSSSSSTLSPTAMAGRGGFGSPLFSAGCIQSSSICRSRPWCMTTRMATTRPSTTAQQRPSIGLAIFDDRVEISRPLPAWRHAGEHQSISYVPAAQPQTGPGAVQGNTHRELGVWNSANGQRLPESGTTRARLPDMGRRDDCHCLPQEGCYGKSN